VKNSFLLLLGRLLRFWLYKEKAMSKDVLINDRMEIFLTHFLGL